MWSKCERKIGLTSQEGDDIRISEFSACRKDEFPMSDILFEDAQGLYADECTRAATLRTQANNHESQSFSHGEKKQI